MRAQDMDQLPSSPEKLLRPALLPTNELESLPMGPAESGNSPDGELDTQPLGRPSEHLSGGRAEVTSMSKRGSYSAKY